MVIKKFGGVGFGVEVMIEGQKRRPTCLVRRMFRVLGGGTPGLDGKFEVNLSLTCTFLVSISMNGLLLSPR